jgi:hypothetical protein
VETLPRGDQIQWWPKMIAERHASFLESTFYRLLVFMVAGPGPDFLPRSIGAILFFLAPRRLTTAIIPRPPMPIRTRLDGSGTLATPTSAARTVSVKRAPIVAIGDAVPVVVCYPLFTT